VTTIGDRLKRYPSNRLIGLGFLILLGVYLLTTPTVRTDADDAYQFAHEVENGLVADGISRQVLYVPVATLVYEATQIAGLEIRPHVLLLGMSALFAAATVCVQYLVLHRRLGLSRLAALLGSGLLAFAYGYWCFAAEAEIYSVALFLGVLLIYTAFKDTSHLVAWAGIGLLGAVAFLMHGLNVIVAFLAVPVFLLTRRKYNALAAYCSVLVAVVLLGTITAYNVAKEEDESYLDFYSENSQLTLTVNNVQRAAVGSGQSVIASGFLFSYEDFAELVSEITPNRSIVDEVYLAATIGSLHRGTMTATFILSVLAVLAATVLAVPGLARSWGNPLIKTIVVWVAAIAIFQIVSGFGADGPEVWLLALPPFTMALAVGLERSRGTSKSGLGVLGVAVAMIVVHNGLGMLTLQDGEGDRNVAHGAWFLANATSRDLIVTNDSAQFARYLQYESDASVIFLLDAASAGEYLDDIIEEAPDSFDRVLATADAFDPPEWVRVGWPEYHHLAVIGEAMRPRFKLVEADEFGAIFVLEETAR
jgi:hypothetical protein